MTVTIADRRCRVPGGAEIAFSAGGSGEPALVFVHGGLADRGFWDAQLVAFAPRRRVVAVDLPGHGASGSAPGAWGIPEFGAHVAAVVEQERAERVVLFGNSLGGPVAIEAALRLDPDGRGRVLGVVGVDTFHRLERAMSADDTRARAELFRDNFAAQVGIMTRMLFHPDADPAIVADAERRMLRTPPGTAYEMFVSFGGYDEAAAAARLRVPLLAINGDLYPTDVAAVRAIKPDFDVVVMPHMGHYPMLERPDEFNLRVAETVARLAR